MNFIHKIVHRVVTGTIRPEFGRKRVAMELEQELYNVLEKIPVIPQRVPSLLGVLVDNQALQNIREEIGFDPQISRTLEKIALEYTLTYQKLIESANQIDFSSHYRKIRNCMSLKNIGKNALQVLYMHLDDQRIDVFQDGYRKEEVRRFVEYEQDESLKQYLTKLILPIYCNAVEPIIGKRSVYATLEEGLEKAISHLDIVVPRIPVHLGEKFNQDLPKRVRFALHDIGIQTYAQLINYTRNEIKVRKNSLILSTGIRDIFGKKGVGVQSSTKLYQHLDKLGIDLFPGGYMAKELAR